MDTTLYDEIAFATNSSDRVSANTITCRFEFTENQCWLTGNFILNGKDCNRQAVAKDASKCPQSLKEFQAEFIQKMQSEIILDYAAKWGVVVASENFLPEFWTRDFILRLSDALRRPRKNPSNLNAPFLKLYLQAAWTNPRLKLCDMTSEELAAHLNNTFHADPKITPAAARKMAQRLELFSTLETQQKPDRDA